MIATCNYKDTGGKRPHWVTSDPLVYLTVKELILSFLALWYSIKRAGGRLQKTELKFEIYIPRLKISETSWPDKSELETNPQDQDI